MRFKDIDYEINRLQDMKEQIISFNRLRKSNPNVVAITNDKFNDFMRRNLLNEDIIYCTFDNEMAQYIDNCIT
jgi:hypothetical protein